MPMNIETRKAPLRQIYMPAPADEDVPAERPELGEVFAAAFRRENIVGSFITNADTIAKSYTDEEGYDQFEGNEGSIFEFYPEELAGVGSPEEKEDLRAKLEREHADLETLASAGFIGWGAMIAAGFLDPLILVPFGGAAGAVRMGVAVSRLAKMSAPLQGGIRTARAAVLGATSSEVVLGSQQELRTWGESALNIGSAAFLSGVLGAGIGKMDSALTNAALKDVKKQLGEVAGGRGDDVVDPNAVKLTADEVRADSAGESKNMEIKLKKNFGAARVMAAMRMSPFVRLMVESRSNKLKETLLHLTDAPAIVEGWSPAISVFQKTQRWDVVLNQLAEGRVAGFVEYRKRMTGATGKGPAVRLKAKLDDKIHKTDMLERGILNETEFEQEVGRAVWSGDRSPIPEVQRVAERYRAELYDPILERAIQHGMLPQEIAEKGVIGARSYLTRVPIKNNIIAYREQFSLRLKNYFKETLTDDELDTITKKHQGISHEEAIDIEVTRVTEDTIDEIVGWSDARMQLEPIKAPSPSPFKNRTLAIEDDVLRAPIPDGEGGWVHFYDNNIDTVARAYVRTVAPDLELTARFGSTNAESQIRAIGKEYKELIAAEPNTKKRLKLSKQMSKEIQIMEDLIDRHRNIYKNPDDHAGITALRVARTANVLAQGGGFMISSIPDIGMVVMRNGLWRTFSTGIVPLVTHFKAVKLAANEAKLMGVGLEMAESRFGAMADMGDEFARNKIERGAQKLTRNFMMWNLLAPWNTVMKRWTGVITQTRMIEAIRKMQRGAASKSDIEDLRQVGIGEEMAKKINAMLDGPNGMHSDGPVSWAHTREWEDLTAREAFSAGLRNAVDQTIVTPGLADRPLFMSTELGKTVTQYKSFAIAATQRVMLTGLQKRNMAALNGTAIMLSLGLGVEAMKNLQAGRDLPEGPYEMLTAALDRSGTIGIFADAFNIAERTGVLPVKGPLSNRYAARNTTSALLGPTLGLGESAVRLAISAGTTDFSQAETRIVRRLIPWQNLFYFRKLFDHAEEGINTSLGIPKRSKK